MNTKLALDNPELGAAPFASDTSGAPARIVVAVAVAVVAVGSGLASEHWEPGSAPAPRLLQPD